MSHCRKSKYPVIERVENEHTKIIDKMVERLKRDRDMSIYTLTNIYGFSPSERAIVNRIDDDRV